MPQLLKHSSVVYSDTDYHLDFTSVYLYVFFIKYHFILWTKCLQKEYICALPFSYIRSGGLKGAHPAPPP